MPDLEPGTVLSGQYRIECKIGQGAVATVYAARDTELDEDIALKAIPTFGNTEAAKQAVLPEYKAVRRLKSSREHILHIDRPTVCEHSGMDMVLLPMEPAEKSVRDWLEETEAAPGIEGRLEEGLALLRQACRGVEALHEQGLAHMDLKPENLLLTEGGDGSPEEATEWTVKVADFGLARSLRRGEVLNEEVVAEGVGTPYYMAPEQIWAARQKEVGPAADIYSLGVILFEMLDGDRPFDGTAETVRKKHREMAPPDVYTDVPGRLEALAHECLEKEAGDRPSSVGAIREELTLETSGEIKVLMPKIGENMTEGTVIAWHKQPGDEVEQDEILLEIGTDKVDTEVPAPEGGVLTKIFVEEGDTVEVGTTVARMKVRLRKEVQSAPSAPKDEPFTSTAAQSHAERHRELNDESLDPGGREFRREPNETLSDEDMDDKFEEAARIIVHRQQGSVSLLQRKLAVSYTQAARITDQLEEAGIVDTLEDNKIREVLVDDEDELNHLLHGD
jgi:serine/threonine protein kinase